MTPTFSVVTPCFNAVHWLPGCLESVANQRGVLVQHIVQDGHSTDGSAEYLLTQAGVDARSEPDAGMYDAVNRAWARATGEFVVHLNADEQLLPGALQAVAECFQTNPDIDVVLTGTLICNQDGSLNCYRKPIRPAMALMLTSHQPVHTCSIFLRHSSFANRTDLYDSKFRVSADVHLLMDIVRSGKRMAILNLFTSAFLLTGVNLGLTQSPVAAREYKYQLSLAPTWMRLLRKPIRVLFHLRKLLAGHYSEGRIEYSLFRPGPTPDLVRFVAEHPTGIYRPYKTISPS